MSISVDDDVKDSVQVDVFAPLRAVLDQLAHVIESLDDDKYAVVPTGPFEGSVGGHVRHCLDHVRALIDAVSVDSDACEVNYDERQRGTAIETDCQAALRCIGELVDALEQRSAVTPNHPLTVVMMLTGDGQSARLRSTLGRELVFVLSHTIHHNAMIGAMVRTHGGEVPTWFGYAPSTVAYLAATCLG